MIAAAAAAMIGGVYATDVCTDEGDLVSHCLVYDLQIKVKTLTPKYGYCKSKANKCSQGECSELYYLDNTSRTLKGYIWFCEDDCWDMDTEAYVVLWDAKSKTAIIPIYYMKDKEKKTTKYFYETDGISFSFLGRYSKGMKKVAAAWALDTEFIYGNAAGVNGSLIQNKDEGTAMLKSISGNFAGMAQPSLTVKHLCDEDELLTGVYANLCDCIDSWCEADQEAEDGVPASGTWSLKYNKKISYGTKPMFNIVPHFALVNEDAE